MDTSLYVFTTWLKENVKNNNNKNKKRKSPGNKLVNLNVCILLTKFKWNNF